MSNSSSSRQTVGGIFVCGGGVPRYKTMSCFLDKEKKVFVKMKTLLWFLCALVVGCATGKPSQGYRYVPRQAMMFGGYYSNPLFSRNYNIVPHGSMSAVVTRDTVATNSYAGDPPQYPPLDVLPVEENETAEKAVNLQYVPPEVEQLPPEQVRPVEPVTPPAQPVQLEAEEPQEELLSPPAAPSEGSLIEDVALAEEISTEAAVTKATKRAPKKKVIRPPPPTQVDDEEDDDEGLSAVWPFAAGKGTVPSYNAFFPISISGGAVSRTRSQGQGQNLEDYYPGSATAIANSFSTGKGGIATSHATSFGDPYLASLVRNGLLNFKSKKTQEA